MTDATLIEALKCRNSHRGTQHVVVTKTGYTGKQAKAVQYRDEFGQLVYTLASEIVSERG